MFDIVLKNIKKNYKNKKILENFSLRIPAGSFFVLLGPSGSGKTTVLRLIGGFEYPNKGNIYFGDEDVTDIPAYLRKVNTIFQNYSLFPHLDVYENIAYGLKIKKLSPFEIRKKVEKIAETFSIGKYLYKDISELSGGEQQRVAIARAIANEPEVLLLDEPISALDIKLRERMLHELSDLQSQLKVTFVYVTHDQFEALAVADYIAVFNEGGIIEQIGTPREIYEQPRSRFVAEFIGKTNFINCTLTATSCIIEDLGEFDYVPDNNSFSVETHSSYIMSIRPERLSIYSEINNNTKHKQISTQGLVKNIVYFGYATEYTVVTKIGIIKVLDQITNQNIQENDKILLEWNIADTVLLKK